MLCRCSSIKSQVAYNSDLVIHLWNNRISEHRFTSSIHKSSIHNQFTQNYLFFNYTSKFIIMYGCLKQCACIKCNVWPKSCIFHNVRLYFVLFYTFIMCIYFSKWAIKLLNYLNLSYTPNTWQVCKWWVARHPTIISNHPWIWFGSIAKNNPWNSTRTITNNHPWNSDGIFWT